MPGDEIFPVLKTIVIRDDPAEANTALRDADPRVDDGHRRPRSHRQDAASPWPRRHV
jgi:hypothetical protein